MNPSVLAPHTLHPRTWESWVPLQLLEQYIYDREHPCAVGRAPGTGWFILTKDPDERILYCEQELEPTPVPDPTPMQWGKIGRPKALPRLDGTCMTPAALVTILKFPATTMEPVLKMEIGAVQSVQVQDRVFALNRIHPDLYRVLNIRRVSEPSTPRPA